MKRALAILYALTWVYALGAKNERVVTKAPQPKDEVTWTVHLREPRALSNDRTDAIVIATGGAHVRDDPEHVYVSTRDGAGWYINRVTGLALPCVKISTYGDPPCQFK